MLKAGSRILGRRYTVYYKYKDICKAKGIFTNCIGKSPLWLIDRSSEIIGVFTYVNYMYGPIRAYANLMMEHIKAFEL